MLAASKKGKKDKPDEDKDDADGNEEKEEPTTLAERWRRMMQDAISPAERLQYQEIYHDGQSLHLCTGETCSACRR